MARYGPVAGACAPLAAVTQCRTEVGGYFVSRGMVALRPGENNCRRGCVCPGLRPACPSEAFGAPALRDKPPGSDDLTFTIFRVGENWCDIPSPLRGTDLSARRKLRTRRPQPQAHRGEDMREAAWEKKAEARGRKCSCRRFDPHS